MLTSQTQAPWMESQLWLGKVVSNNALSVKLQTWEPRSTSDASQSVRHGDDADGSAECPRRVTATPIGTLPMSAAPTIDA